MIPDCCVLRTLAILKNIYNYHIIDDLKMQEGAAGSAAPVYRITAIPALHCR